MITFTVSLILLVVCSFMMGWSLKAMRILTGLRVYLKELKGGLDGLEMTEEDSAEVKMEKYKSLHLNKGQFEAIKRISDLI